MFCTLVKDWHTIGFNTKNKRVETKKGAFMKHLLSSTQNTAPEKVNESSEGTLWSNTGMVCNGLINATVTFVGLVTPRNNLRVHMRLANGVTCEETKRLYRHICEYIPQSIQPTLENQRLQFLVDRSFHNNYFYQLYISLTKLHFGASSICINANAENKFQVAVGTSIIDPTHRYFKGKSKKLPLT